MGQDQRISLLFQRIDLLDQWPGERIFWGCYDLLNLLEESLCCGHKIKSLMENWSGKSIHNPENTNLDDAPI
jgi:hypothetical protein